MARVSQRWEHPGTVAGFVSGVPNEVLLAFARRFRDADRPTRCLDIGCGAARNAVPLAGLGFHVVGTDLSAPMLEGARERMRSTPGGPRVDLVIAPMAPLPFPGASFDLVVAHGIWNLARSGEEFRAGVAEAARVARPGAGLFVFTFSRRTLPASAVPDAGEAFVFSSWNGEPQCFLTEGELVDELGRAGFVRDSSDPLTEYNVPRPGELRTGGPPVIYEGTFVRGEARQGDGKER
jgi:SAM-dependent methyltransferase